MTDRTIIFAASILRPAADGTHAILLAEADQHLAIWSIWRGSHKAFRSGACTPAEAVAACEART